MALLSRNNVRQTAIVAVTANASAILDLTFQQMDQAVSKSLNPVRIIEVIYRISHRIHLSDTKCLLATAPPPPRSCPQNSSPSSDGTACKCNEGFQPSADGSACLAVQEPLQQCPANSFSAGDGKCQCNPGFDVSAEGATCVKVSNGTLIALTNCTLFCKT